MREIWFGAGDKKIELCVYISVFVYVCVCLCLSVWIGWEMGVVLRNNFDGGGYKNQLVLGGDW